MNAHKVPEDRSVTVPVADHDLVSIKEASAWASSHLGRTVTPANIAYLIQYGRIRKSEKDGATVLSLAELHAYYAASTASRKSAYTQKLGGALNWALSFDQYTEAERTKHVHRLHPYKGKFIPQLVEYFLDDHTDTDKKTPFFQKGDLVLDPFSGSGTTLVQAAELGINALGIEVSAFNALIGNAKVDRYDHAAIEAELRRISAALHDLNVQSNKALFEAELSAELHAFNSRYFPAPDYKYKLRKKELHEADYAPEKERLFMPVFEKLVEKYGIKRAQDAHETFLDIWFSPQVRAEIELVFAEIMKIRDEHTRKILSLVLSRTMRSCRATTHADLATLLEPVTAPYYCAKHGKICKPLFSLAHWWKTYTKDTVKRLKEFETLRTETKQLCVVGDSRTLDLLSAVESIDPDFAALVKRQKIAGIFSSPPYVGLIDYHEQHAYAYDLFQFERNDSLEIGPLFRGQGSAAQDSYRHGIAAVLNNCKRFMVNDYHVFLVANDKYKLYPSIAEEANMTIVQQFHRPVLNRTEKDKAAYSETIFHLREKA